MRGSNLITSQPCRLYPFSRSLVEVKHLPLGLGKCSFYLGNRKLSLVVIECENDGLYQFAINDAVIMGNSQCSLLQGICVYRRVGHRLLQEDKSDTLTIKLKIGFYSFICCPAHMRNTVKYYDVPHFKLALKIVPFFAV